MIVDCFTFFNELDVLEIRLHELYDKVDYFVLVEASKTQSLLDKPYFFDNSKNRFERFLHKIIHVQVDTYPQFTHIWGMENYQRNNIITGLKRVPGITKSDIVMISDLDEIPAAKSIEKIKQSNADMGSLMMDFRAYFYNYRAARNWIGTAFAKAALFNDMTPQDLRNTKDSLPLLDDGKINGWHLSWMGGVKRVWEKAFCCIEPFDKGKIISFDEFELQFNDLIKRGAFMHLENINKTGEKFYIEKDLYTLPVSLVDNIEKFHNSFLWTI